MVAFVSTLGVFPNVVNEYFTFKCMNLGEGIWVLSLTNDSIFCTDSLQETNIMITSKQGMWIIRFDHDNGSFQSNQSVLYDFNLRSLPFDQVQDVTNIEFSTYKDI